MSFSTPPSTVNSQQSTITDGATGIDITSTSGYTTLHPAANLASIYSETVFERVGIEITLPQ
ncbi:hypothetical protein [Microcoleus sp. B9-D4]|uniref:hypothetical protein n=1 Tax=Microcoleus sp. B9-D4 TaxID=2818711 RepID=UPI002FD096B9